MYTTIQKWGNSHAIRLPKVIMEEAAFYENERVEITAENGCIFIKPVAKKHVTMEERIANYHGDYVYTEWDTGKPRGNEVW